MSRRFVTLALAAAMSIGLQGRQKGSWQWVSLEGPPLSPASRVLTVGDAVLVQWFNSTRRSLDGGATWETVSKPLQSQPKMAAAGGLLYVETQAGLIRSADAGDSFESCGALPTDRSLSRAIETLAAHPTAVYVAVRNVGVFRSRDRCASWTPMSLPAPRFGQDSIFTVSGLLIVRSWPRMLVSADDGDSWYEADASLQSPNAFAVECSGSILAATLTGLFRSRDSGRTWSAAGLARRPVRGVQAAGCEYLAAVVDADVQQPPQLMESSDGGATWTPADEQVGTAISAVAVAASGTRYAVGSAGAFRRLPRGAWQSIGPIGEVTSLAVAGDTVIARTSGGGTFRRDAGRDMWQPLSMLNQSPRSLYGGAVYSIGTIGATELFARQTNGILRSADQGRTWRHVRLDRFPHSVVALSDGALLAGTEDGIFRLEAQSEQWREYSSGLEEFRIAAVAAGRGQTAFAASWEGRVYRSVDRGETWSPLGTARGYPVSGLIETKDGALLIASGGAVARWDYSRRAWSIPLYPEVVVDGSPGNTLGGIPLPQGARVPTGVSALMQMRGGTVIAAGRDSLFVSEDDGKTWRTEPSPGGRVNALVEDAQGRLYAATTSGVWSATIR